MATPLAVLLIVSAVITLGALGLAMVRLWSGTKRLARSTRDIRADIQPTVEAINADVRVAQQELERVQEAIDELKASRDR